MRACRLCDLTAGSVAGRQLLYQDEVLSAFASKHPRCRVHLLVAPRQHLPQSKMFSLAEQAEGHEILHSMLMVGKELLGKSGEANNSWRFMFHRPPFNSEDHLHMHCMAGPFTNYYRRLAHTTGTPWGVCAEDLLRKSSFKA